MTATLDQANDDILAVLKTAWDAVGHPMQWPNVAFEKPSAPSPWARATVHFAPGPQSLTGGLGTTRYERRGLLTVQIFTAPGEGTSSASMLAETLMTAYEGASTPNGVWFRNARADHVGPSEGWWQTNFRVDFVFEEVR